MKKGRLITLAFLAAYALFCILALILGWDSGKDAVENMGRNLLDMVKILPCAFVLISLFEVWVKRETVEKHLGERAGWKSFLWACLLGGLTLGPMLTALPVASVLKKKGAALSVILTYLGASAVCRIPMTIFEASYLGVKFTVIRYLTAIPLIIMTSFPMSRYLKRYNLSSETKS